MCRLLCAITNKCINKIFHFQFEGLKWLHSNGFSGIQRSVRKLSRLSNDVDNDHLFQGTDKIRAGAGMWRGHKAAMKKTHHSGGSWQHYSNFWKTHGIFFCFSYLALTFTFPALKKITANYKNVNGITDAPIQIHDIFFCSLNESSWTKCLWNYRFIQKN